MLCSIAGHCTIFHIYEKLGEFEKLRDCLLHDVVVFFKGMFRTKMRKLPNSHVVSILYDFLYFVEHKGMYF